MLLQGRRLEERDGRDGIISMISSISEARNGWMHARTTIMKGNITSFAEVEILKAFLRGLHIESGRPGKGLRSYFARESWAQANPSCWQTWWMTLF